MVVFREKTATEITAEPPLKDTTSERDKQMVEMEKALQANIEQLEISNEELQSRNEELQATNEELQSSIEELETSKEEAQSTNEELSSVNEELKQKISDLNEANNDINNLLASTEVATIFLDSALCIKRYTPAASTIFNLIKSDIGRPIRDITSNISYESLDNDAQRVLETLEKQEREIQTPEGYWYAVRILPYRTTENVIDGVVITFMDHTTHKLAEAAQDLAEIVRKAGNAVIEVDVAGNFKAWNASAAALYGYNASEVMTMTINSLLPEDRKAEVKDLIGQLGNGEQVYPFVTERVTKSGQQISVHTTVSPLMDEQQQVYAIAMIEQPFQGP